MRREKKIPADSVERLLRGLEADALAVAREARSAFAAAALVGDADVYQADWFFGCSAARPGNSGDADAQRCAGAFANALGESESGLGADRAFGVDYVGRHADQGGFQLVAIANYAAEEIGRAAGNVGETLGEHSAGTTFGHGDGGAIFSKRACHYIFE